MNSQGVGSDLEYPVAGAYLPGRLLHVLRGNPHGLLNISRAGIIQPKKELRNDFDEINKQLVQVFVDCINKVYHTGTTEPGEKGYADLCACDIIFSSSASMVSLRSPRSKQPTKALPH